MKLGAYLGMLLVIIQFNNYNIHLATNTPVITDSKLTLAKKRPPLRKVPNIQ